MENDRRVFIASVNAELIDPEKIAVETAAGVARRSAASASADAAADAALAEATLHLYIV